MLAALQRLVQAMSKPSIRQSADRSVPVSLRRWAAGAFCAAYLGIIAGYLLLQVLDPTRTRTGRFVPSRWAGDVRRASYFWTWDMYPGYSTASVHREIIGEAADGSYLRLYPSTRDRFRWGMHGETHRLDFYQTAQADLYARELVEERLRERNDETGDGTLRRIYVVERYWPVRYNLPDELYDEIYVPLTASGEPLSREPDTRRRWWRVIAEAKINEENRLEWKRGVLD